MFSTTRALSSALLCVLCLGVDLFLERKDLSTQRRKGLCRSAEIIEVGLGFTTLDSEFIKLRLKTIARRLRHNCLLLSGSVSV